MVRQCLRTPHKQIRPANAFFLNIEGMLLHLETYAENPAGLSDIQEANLQAAAVELRLAFSVFPLMHNSSVVVVPQPDTQVSFPLPLYASVPRLLKLASEAS